jgi:hypothetical protein
MGRGTEGENSLEVEVGVGSFGGGEGGARLERRVVKISHEDFQAG